MIAAIQTITMKIARAIPEVISVSNFLMQAETDQTLARSLRHRIVSRRASSMLMSMCAILGIVLILLLDAHVIIEDRQVFFSRVFKQHISIEQRVVDVNLGR